MLLNRDFTLLESNMCPDCGSPYFRTGVGSEKGIHCQNCGYMVPIAKYREVMKNFVSQKFLAVPADEEVEQEEPVIA